jgi:WD40-like Beta Propeller Repeat
LFLVADPRSTLSFVEMLMPSLSGSGGRVARGWRVRLARRAGVAVAAVSIAVFMSGCGAHARPAASSSAPSSSAASSSASAKAAAVPPVIVAVTSGGALVTLDPSTGAVQQTLVGSGVAGGEVSAAANGLVYFAVQSGCTSTIEEVPVGGGSPAVIVSGSLPAVSPDGTKLAYTTQPSLTPGCVPSVSDFDTLYNLHIRTLRGSSTTTLPMVAAGQGSGLGAPVSFLSWSADSDHLAVSVAAAEDNEGWSLNLVDTSQAQYYLTGTGVTIVPVTGTDAQQSYLRQGVYMPNGDLFVSRACCAGFPVQNTSKLMWEVDTSGALVQQVAVGFADLDHTSLDVSPDGNWLLYLAGTGLYLSQGGATPKELTTGMIAAAFG